jgi:hypothetical protein
MIHACFPSDEMAFQDTERRLTFNQLTVSTFPLEAPVICFFNLKLSRSQYFLTYNSYSRRAASEKEGVRRRLYLA